jgi:uncharacterized protein (DUF3084 family)
MRTGAVSAASRARTQPWIIAVLWLTVTLALFAATTGVLLVRREKARLHDAETKYGRAIADAQQARIEQDREKVAFAAASAERENALTAELNVARTQVEQLTAEVRTQRQSVTDLTGRLDQLATELATWESHRKSLTHQVASARASVAMLKFKSSIVDVARELPRQLEQSLARNREAVAAAADRLPVAAPLDAPRARRLPSIPASDQDRYTVGLRPIVGQTH